jgi:hypothetical protein
VYTRPSVSVYRGLEVLNPPESGHCSMYSPAGSNTTMRAPPGSRTSPLPSAIAVMPSGLSYSPGPPPCRPMSRRYVPSGAYARSTGTWTSST